MLRGPVVGHSGGYVRPRDAGGEWYAVEPSPQSWQVFGALLEGFEQQAGIIAFLLIIGGAFQIMNHTRAIDVGILSFLRGARRAERHAFFRRLGVDRLVIAAVILLFSLFGAIFGMSEETLAFVVIIIPLAISMGYDSIVGLCMVYVAAHVGFSGAILNPFTIGIAQGLSDLPLFSGFGYRVFCWCVLTAVLIAAVLHYAARIRKDPRRSPMYEADAYWRERHGATTDTLEATPATRSAWVVYGLILAALAIFAWQHPSTTFRVGRAAASFPALPVLAALFALTAGVSLRRSGQFFILNLLAYTVAFLVVGVMGYGWYLTEISAIFLAMGLLAGFAHGMDADGLIEQFLRGAKDMLSAALVVGLAGGIIQILQDGRIIDPILHGLAALMGDAGRVVSLGAMYAIQTVINLFIPSGSAKAALTMPIMAPFSDVIGISRQATVLAFQFGDGFTNMYPHLGRADGRPRPRAYSVRGLGALVLEVAPPFHHPGHGLAGAHRSHPAGRVLVFVPAFCGKSRRACEMGVPASGTVVARVKWVFQRLERSSRT